LPNPDAIEEFRVMANNYSTEYGRFAGGVITVITKSGTNQLHGSLFEFLRNDKLNAKDWGSNIPKPPLRRNQFGGTVGGPIKRDKTFFFFSYAGLRQSQSTYVSSAAFPTALERSGNFSQSLSKPVNPVTKHPYSCGSQLYVICPSQMDPVALRILDTYVPAVANGPRNTLQAYIPTPTNCDEFLLKIDRQYTRAFGSRVSYPQASLGDLGSMFAIQGPPNLPNIGVTGYFNLGEQISGPLAGNNFYALRDLVSSVKGKHNITFGAEESLNKDIQTTNLNNFGNFAFNGSITGNGLADFLLGIPSAVGQDQPVSPETNTWDTAFFLEDDYRVSPRLTLNLGLR
jgi:outer membrane receptor protein involved in Fe transport